MTRPRPDAASARLLAVAAALLAACSNAQPQAWAGQVTSRSQLIGGPRALGDLGDYRLSNDRVRFIIQDIKGPSRAFSTQGGSLLDADLARPDEELDPRTQTNGQDGLGELFPAFFLGAIAPDSLTILDDGSKGGVARIRISGKGADFLTQGRIVDQVLLGDGLRYSVDYSLGPNDDYLLMTSAMVNLGPSDHFFPTDVAPLPVGFVGLFGDGQPIFLTGQGGYDLRFQLQGTYARTYPLPTMPGLTGEVLVVDGPALSYGLTFCTDCASPLPTGVPGVSGFVWNHRAVYGQYDPSISTESMLMPFIAGSLFGLFAGEPPQYLPAGKAYTVSMKLRVGLPGPATQIDAFYGERGDDVGTVTGVVREERSERPLPDASVVVFAGNDVSGLAMTSARTDSGGRFHAKLPPGRYTAVARLLPHGDSAPLQFELRLNQTTYLQPQIPRTALLLAEISDQTGRLIPAKVTLDAAYDQSHLNQDPKSFLYDLRLGDPYRPTDLIPDTSDPETRRYLEGAYRAINGRLQTTVRPGSYRVTISRGPAYSISTTEVTLVAGQASSVSARLTRLLPSNHRVAADLHVHAQGSIDSAVSYEDRVASFAVEGIDFLALTEHNNLYDLQPTVQALGLGDFVQTTVGTEVSSLEAGHWNAYPLTYQSTPAAHGQVPWFQKDPGKLFNDLRAAGKYGAADTVVQVNHPRDTSLGYFTEYGLTGESLTGDPAHDWPGAPGLFAPNGPGFGPGAFSLDFDALEILTGKRFEKSRTYRVPDPPPPPPVPPPCDSSGLPKGCMGPPGSIVRDAAGLVEYPGAIEDWEHLLDSGRRLTALGNSDSHNTLDGEGGYPRNLIALGHGWDSARQIDELEVARAIKGGNVLVTNGPEITLTAIDFLHRGPDGKPVEVPVGGLVQSDSTGAVQVHLVIEAAPWLEVNQAVLLVSRGACDETLGDCRAVPLTLPLQALAPGAVRRLDTVVTVNLPPGQDGWIAAQASGDKSMWPVVIPLEVPPLLLSDAVGALEASFGLKNKFGNLKPTVIRTVKPWAMTNAILVDGNGDGKFGPAAPRRPAPPPGRAEAGTLLLELGQGDDRARIDLAGRLAEWR